MESSSNNLNDKLIMDSGEFWDHISYEYGSFLSDVNIEIINILKKQLLNEEIDNMTQKDNSSNLDLNDSVNSLNLELRCSAFHVVVTTKETSDYNFYFYNDSNKINGEAISALVIFNQHHVKIKLTNWWSNNQTEHLLPQLQLSHDDHKSSTIVNITLNRFCPSGYENKMVAEMTKFLYEIKKKSHLVIRKVELEKSNVDTIITFDIAFKSSLRHESGERSVERYRDAMKRTKLFFPSFASWMQIQNIVQTHNTMNKVSNSNKIVRRYFSYCSIPKHLNYKYPANVQQTWDQILLKCSLAENLKHEITRKIINLDDPWILPYSTLVKRYFKEFQNDKKKTRFLRL